MDAVDDYLTVEQYRKKVGFSSRQPIYRAVRKGRLPSKRFGITIMIPKNAVLTDNRITTGKYIGIRQWVDRQISNVEMLDDIYEKKKGISTSRKKNRDPYSDE